MLDRPVLGIVLMLCFCILAPMGDALAKLAGGQASLVQLALVRFCIQAVVLMPLALALGHSLRFGRRLGWIMLARTGLHVVALLMLFLALRYLPLADAVAILFVMPFFVLILGKFVLGEEVGPRRLIACMVGFAGTLLVIQPSFANVGWPALLPLGVALCFAFFMLLTRQISRQIDPLSLQAISGAMAIPLLGLPYLVAPTHPELALILPGAQLAMLLALIGILGSLSHLLMTWALRYAPTATLAPMQYLEIPVATLLGYLIFSDWPNGLAIAGIGITMASGLYVIYREQIAARHPAAASF